MSADPDPSEWLACIHAVLDSGKTDAFGLLLHRYSGGLDARIALKGRQIVERSALDTQTLLTMQEDVLYEFRR
jgi:hypothetical protein